MNKLKTKTKSFLMKKEILCCFFVSKENYFLALAAAVVVAHVVMSELTDESEDYLFRCHSCWILSSEGLSTDVKQGEAGRVVAHDYIKEYLFFKLSGIPNYNFPKRYY